MERGRAPIGPDGNPIELHHTIQSEPGRVAEVTSSFHSANHSALHINPSTTPSGVDRPAFNRWKKNYWKGRASDFG
jgi:filamentous hemagglutinin